MMKKLLLWTFSLLLAISTVSVSVVAQDNDRRADREANEGARRVAGREPHMAAALEHLRQAADELEKATRNKGGHRAKALDLTHQAISQVEQGVKYDEEHPNR
jgi:hypothetical protein